MDKFWEVTPVFVIFPVFALMFKWYFEYRTRKYLIDKGMVDEKAKFLQFAQMTKNGPSSLKWGLVFLFVGVAVVFLRTLSEYVPDEVVLGAILIAAGVGLLLNYLIVDAKAKKSHHQERHGFGSAGPTA
jgi:hypothetical protein